MTLPHSEPHVITQTIVQTEERDLKLTAQEWNVIFALRRIRRTKRHALVVFRCDKDAWQVYEANPAERVAVVSGE